MNDLKNLKTEHFANEQWLRLQTIIEHYGMTAHGFANYLELNSSENLYRIKHGKNGISRQLAERIVRHCPEIRKCWLLCGEGEMLRSESS